MGAGRVVTGIAVAALLALAALGQPSVARAEPYLSVRSGEKCSACHVNPTGGGMRKDEVCKFCRVDTLYNRTDLQAAGEAPRPDFTGRLNDFVFLGADLRLDYRDTAVPDAPRRREFEPARGQVYLELQALPGLVTLYLDQQVLPASAFAREGFVLLHLPFARAYVKAGRFFLPFGYRRLDETAFVRSVPGYTMEAPDNGVEIGLEPGPFSLALAVTNGTAGAPEDNADKQATASASWVSRYAQVGASYANNTNAAGTERAASSVFGGLGLGSLAVQLEVATVTDTPVGLPATEQRAALAEADWEVVPGANLKLTEEWMDPDTGAAADARRRSSLVFEPFVMPQTQVRTGLRVSRSEADVPAQKAREWFLELHVYL